MTNICINVTRLHSTGGYRIHQRRYSFSGWSLKTDDVTELHVCFIYIGIRRRNTIYMIWLTETTLILTSVTWCGEGSNCCLLHHKGCFNHQANSRFDMHKAAGITSQIDMQWNILGLSFYEHCYIVRREVQRLGGGGGVWILSQGKHCGNSRPGVADREGWAPVRVRTPFGFRCKAASRADITDVHTLCFHIRSAFFTKSAIM